MNLLKENEEKRSRKEERENHHHHRARELQDVDVTTYVSAAWRRGITLKDLDEAALRIGMSADEVRGWLQYMDETNWTLKEGDKVNVRNFRRSLRMWHKVNGQIEERLTSRRGTSAEREDERRKEAARQKFDALKTKAAEDPKVWTLCRERCANAKECGGCEKCHKIPPALIPPRGFPPEECVDFKAKEVA